MPRAAEESMSWHLHQVADAWQAAPRACSAVAWVFVSNLEAPITSVATKRRPTETERKLCSTCILCPSIRGWCQLNRNFTNLRVLLHTDSITSSAQAQHSELADKRSRNVLRLPWTFICKYQTQDIYCMYQYVKKQKIDTFFYLFGHKFESGAVSQSWT